jgi:hypothetical protein
MNPFKDALFDPNPRLACGYQPMEILAHQLKLVCVYFANLTQPVEAIQGMFTS